METAQKEPARFSRYVKTEYNRRQRLLSRIRDRFSAVRSFRQSSEWLNAEIRLIQASDDWKRAPRPTHEYLNGYKHAMHDALWCEMGFYYVVPGKGPVLAKLLEGEDLHNAGKYPCGHAWPPIEGRAFAWYTGPEVLP